MSAQVPREGEDMIQVYAASTQEEEKFQSSCLDFASGRPSLGKDVAIPEQE